MHISGIQQIGIGVADVQTAFTWYRKHFGTDIIIFEEVATAHLMLPYTGGEPQNRHAIFALNLQGGGGFEIWQFTNCIPMPPAFRLQLGDLGIFIAKVKCRDVYASHQFFQRNGHTMPGPILRRPDGREHFFLKDPWDNTFEVVAADNWFSKNLPSFTGGICGATIGVADMDKAMLFYKNVLGYDYVVFDETGGFEDLDGVDGAEGKFRRVLLGHSDKRSGPFSRLYGDTEIELVQSLDRQPATIYEGRFWGHPGFIHLCFDVTNMKEMKSRCCKFGHPFTVDSEGSFEMENASGHFSYVEDPDGALIEFVQIYKLPILKKIGWHLDLRKRSNARKPLADWMVRSLSFARVKD